MTLSTAAPGETEISLKGVLTIAGRSKDISLSARAETGSGMILVSGAYDLLMTDYGVTPPSLMMGAIKTRNEITVRYVLRFAFEDKN